MPSLRDIATLAVLFMSLYFEIFMHVRGAAVPTQRQDSAKIRCTATQLRVSVVTMPPWRRYPGAGPELQDDAGVPSVDEIFALTDPVEGLEGPG